MDKQDVITAKGRGIIDQIIPPGSNLEKYRRPEGPLKFTLDLLGDDTSKLFEIGSKETNEFAESIAQ